MARPMPREAPVTSAVGVREECEELIHQLNESGRNPGIPLQQVAKSFNDLVFDFVPVSKTGTCRIPTKRSQVTASEC